MPLSTLIVCSENYHRWMCTILHHLANFWRRGAKTQSSLILESTCSTRIIYTQVNTLFMCVYCHWTYLHPCSKKTFLFHTVIYTLQACLWRVFIWLQAAAYMYMYLLVSWIFSNRLFTENSPAYWSSNTSQWRCCRTCGNHRWVCVKSDFVEN